MENGIIRVNMTHRECCEEIVSLIEKYTQDQYCSGTDWGWRIGVNENGEPDATCDKYQDHFGATTIPVVFYDTQSSGEISLGATCEMSADDVHEWYVEEFMEKTPDGFERLEFLSE